jgi:hypothetical protein
MATPFIKESISPQRAKALPGDLAAKANNEIKTNKPPAGHNSASRS